MNILLLIPLWKRPEVVKLMVDHLRFPDYANVRPLFILSDDDPHYDELEFIIRDYDSYIYHNTYLGRKKNAGLRHALRFEWDYLMELGSDDIVTDKLWDYYVQPFDEGWALFGINSLHIYNLLDHKAGFISDYAVDAYDKPMPIGAGRCIRRDVVEASIPLWKDTWNCSMDGCSYHKIQRIGYTGDVIDVSEDFCLLDIKTNTSISHWLHMKEYVDRYLDPDVVLDAFGVDMNASDSVKLITLDGFHRSVINLANSVNSMRVAFDSINDRYYNYFGEYRYKNYNSYANMISRKNGKL